MVEIGDGLRQPTLTAEPIKIRLLDVFGFQTCARMRVVEPR